jgi:hypothetical protein
MKPAAAAGGRHGKSAAAATRQAAVSGSGWIEGSCQRDRKATGDSSLGGGAKP